MLIGIIIIKIAARLIVASVPALSGSWSAEITEFREIDMQSRKFMALLLSAPAFMAGCSGEDALVGADMGGQLNVVATELVTKANDLRGLTYASNGKIYASGHSGTANALATTAASRKVVIARFNADGTSDTSFDGDGFVEVDVAPGKSEESLGIVELAGGDILVAVNAADGNGGASITASNDPTVTQARADGQNVYLLRFNNAGAPVTTFGTAGKVEVVFGWADSENNTWPVPALTAGATNTFSHAGFPSDTAWDLKIDNTSGVERVVVFGLGSAPRGALNGSSTQRTDVDRYVARLNAATGQPDSTFNAGKAFTWNSGGTFGDNARRGSVEADGKILTAGYTNLGTGNGNHVVLIRLTPAGALDATFTGFTSSPSVLAAQNGVAVFNPFKVDGGVAECYAAVKQSNGGYVTTGYGSATAATTASTLGYKTTTAPDVVTFRVSNGGVDNSWGNNGTQSFQSEGLTQPTTEDRGRDLVRLNDDRTVHVGFFGGVPAAYVVTRDGRLDTRVNGDGIIQLSNTTVSAQFFAVTRSADGKRVAMTTGDHANGARLVILGVED